MTRFAFGSTSSGLTAPFDCRVVLCIAADSRVPTSAFNAMTPSPAAPRPRNVLRLKSRMSFSFMGSIPGDHLVPVQHRSRDGRGRGDVHVVGVGRERPLACAREIAGGRTGG